jgi:hypothetical protein
VVFVIVSVSSAILIMSWYCLIDSFYMISIFL